MSISQDRDCMRSTRRSTRGISTALRLDLNDQSRIPNIFRDANTGDGQDFTGLAAAVQLRRRVAFGLQTLIVKSRLLTGENTVRIRGSPPVSDWSNGLLDYCNFQVGSRALQQSITPIIHDSNSVSLRSSVTRATVAVC
jgi:hypothetical protein